MTRSKVSGGKRRWRGAQRLWAALGGTPAGRKGPSAGRQSDVERLVERGKALLGEGRFEAAETTLTKALAQAPDHPAAMQCLARVAQRTERWTDALARWRALSEARPDNLPARLRMANSLIHLGRCAHAEEVLDQALTRWPDHPKLMAAKARAAQSDGRRSEALARWQAVAERHRGRAGPAIRAARMTAGLLMQMRRFREAEDVLTEARSRWPRNTGLLESAAILAQRDQRWSEALTYWKEVADRRPGQVGARINMMSVLSALGRSAEAGEVLCDAAKRWPNHPRLREHRARALERDRKWSEALLCWREIGASHPDYAVSRVGQHIAICEIRLGRVDAAGRMLERAVGRREEGAVFQRLFGAQAPFIPYYGRQIEDAFRELG